MTDHVPKVYALTAVILALTAVVGLLLFWAV